MKENRLKKTLIEIFTMAVLVFVTYYLIMRDQDFETVWQVIVQSSKFWLLIALLIMAGYVFCGGYAIKILMRGKGRPVSIFNCFKYSLVEIYFSSITPSNTGGQPMQLYYMKKDGYSVADSTAALMCITILYRASFLIITAVMFLFNAGFISERISSVWPLALLGLAVNIVLISALCIALFSKRLIRWLVNKSLRLLGRLHIVRDVKAKKASIDEKIEQYNNCAKLFIENKATTMKAFGVLALQRIALMSIPALIYLSFGLQEYTIFEIFAAQCLLNLCVDLMPLPGSVGISETVFLMLFAPIFTEANVTTAVLLSRGISFYLLLIVAALFVCACRVISIFKGKEEDYED